MVAMPQKQSAVSFLAGEREAMREIARKEIAAALANYIPGGLKPAIFEFDSGDPATALAVPVNAAGAWDVPIHCAAHTWKVTCMNNAGAVVGSAELDVLYAEPGAGIETAVSLIGGGTMPFVTSDYENGARCEGDWDTVNMKPDGQVFATLTSAADAPKVCLTIRLRAKTEGAPVAE